jgi:hypothetical protein
VGKRKNEGATGLAAIDNRIGKPFNQNTPQAAADERANVWVSQDDFMACSTSSAKDKPRP